jgi:drug/metabolite transporter (DMT)-like permease
VAAEPPGRPPAATPAPGRPPRREARVLAGIGFIAAATLLFAVMNTAVKLLSAGLPTVELIWARSLGHLVFVVALFGPGHGGWRLFATRRPELQIGRSLLLLASTSFFFSAIGRVPLADATAVSFTSPFIVAAAAGPLLRERLGRDRWAAIAAGFVGALIVIRPGAGASPYLALVVASAGCYALYQILTRKVAGIDPPETSVTYSALVGTVLLSLLVPFHWRTPDGAGAWLALAGLGLLGGLGHYFVARGLTLGPASVLSPFHYVQLVWAAALGYAVFADVPSLWTWLGAAVIVAGGLYIAWRETRRPGAP